MLSLTTIPYYDCDVVIVGGGPAGASAACYLATAGFKVIILDQRQFPRDKVCGDFVGPVALAELDRLGVTERLDFGTTNIIHTATLYLDGQELIHRGFPDVNGFPNYGRVIPRLTLDQWIVDAALEAGAELYQNHRALRYENLGDGIHVHGICKGEPFNIRARLLLGADGSTSVIARQLSGSAPDQEHCIIAVRAYYTGVDCMPDQADLYFTEESFPGYYWLFPTGIGSANVGVGLALGTIPENETHLRELLNTLVANDKSLHSKLKNAELVGKIVGWPLSTYNFGLPLVADRVMLLGDAAGLINPLNGEGIQTALLSARWASEVAVPYLDSDELSFTQLYSYQAKIESELRYEMALASLIVQLIRNRSLTPVWMKALKIICKRAKRDPKYADIAGGILAGIVPASDAVSIRMVLGTLQEAALSIGMDGVSAALASFTRGPAVIAGMGLDATRMSFQVAYDVLASPAKALRWLGISARLAVELLGQVASHTLRSSH